jgi:hypothetical protein
VLPCSTQVCTRLSPDGFIVVDDDTAWPGGRDPTGRMQQDHLDMSLVRRRPHAVPQKPPA